MQRGLREQSERTFGTDQEASQFDPVVGENTAEMIAAAISLQAGLPLSDQLVVLPQDPFQAVAESLVGIGEIDTSCGFLHQRFARGLDH